MDPIWLKSYQTGVPAEIDPDRYESLAAEFSDSVKRFRNKIAYHHMGQELSYGELDRLATNFAAYLQQQELVKGDRLAIMLPNVLAYPVALFGAFKAGLVVVNVNPLYTERELGYQLNDSGAKAIVILENFAHTLENILSKVAVSTIITARIGDFHKPLKRTLINSVVKYVKHMVPKFKLPNAKNILQTIKIGAKLNLVEVALTPNDIAFLQYTGGTTGVSKGAVLTHHNMMANLEQAKAWMSQDLKNSNLLIVTALPLYHIFSLTANCLTFMSIGGCNLLITNPRDIPNFVKTLKQHKFAVITGVNTLYNALLNNPEFAEVDFANCKIALAGGMAVQRAVAEKWQQVTKRPLIEAYGLTEASPAVCINPLNIKEYNRSIGVPISSTQIEIRDETDQTLGFNEPGELCVKGPQVMEGYWNKPEETALVLRDGWLHTGDIATIDENGFVHIVDRKKDMILVSGFNVYPNEIEEIISQNRKVLEVAVVGIDDADSGERVKAFIVKRDPSLTEDEVIKFCRKSLTRYKIPKEVEFRDELPKTNVGKILRRELR